MSKKTHSCLIEKLSAFIDLSEVDETLLANLEKEAIDYKKHDKVFSVDDEIRHLYVVRKGWLISYTILQDGRRQVLEIHYPGDVIGIPDVPFKHATSNLMALQAATLCPFPKKEMDVILTTSPRLTALLFTLAMIDKSVNLDRLKVLGRMSARERLAHILLEIYSRLVVTKGLSGSGFMLPLSQHDIADAIGLTNVSVSNAFTKLEQDGLIKREAGYIYLLDIKKLTSMSDYINRYREVDISWFPNASTQADGAFPKNT